ncbi:MULTISPECIES: hypothetical protein [unclassified Methylibium]|uniref:hypothetical protein n=1 Tax=unclassified Methylibium TaxID=2633235 RepID=UPI0003F463F6|nr:MULTISPECIES: hypothetical protein [unclassified Methylibium]EWS54842.1 hypothetical protein X551_02332 [Methylibium sp. T29]EWS60213.1 hypothetical protein Y694_01999 [Methylibium sp. T29-B]
MATQETNSVDAKPVDHDQRLKLAYEASVQVDALVGLLMREQQASCDYAADVVLSTLLRRVDELNGVVFAVLAHDDADPTERLRAVVGSGRRAGEIANV